MAITTQGFRVDCGHWKEEKKVVEVKVEKEKR